MTPQEQAQVVMKACGANRGNPIRAALTRLIGAAAIRAAVALVLPEERRLCDRSWQRMIKRAEFLAIADALEAPANG